MRGARESRAEGAPREREREREREGPQANAPKARMVRAGQLGFFPFFPNFSTNTHPRCREKEKMQSWQHLRVFPGSPPP